MTIVIIMIILRGFQVDLCEQDPSARQAHPACQKNTSAIKTALL